MNFRKMGFACKYSSYAQNLHIITILKNYKRCIHLNSKHARDLKFGMHLPCVAFYKFGVAIFENFAFWLTYGQKVAALLAFGSFLAVKL